MICAATSDSTRFVCAHDAEDTVSETVRSPSGMLAVAVTRFAEVPVVVWLMTLICDTAICSPSTKNVAVRTAREDDVHAARAATVALPAFVHPKPAVAVDVAHPEVEKAAPLLFPEA